MTADNIGPATITGRMLASNSVAAAQLAGGSITTPALSDRAVTAAKLDPAMGVSKKSGTAAYYDSGGVGIGPGSSLPLAPLHVFSGGGRVNSILESTSPSGT